HQRVRLQVGTLTACSRLTSGHFVRDAPQILRGWPPPVPAGRDCPLPRVAVPLRAIQHSPALSPCRLISLPTTLFPRCRRVLPGYWAVRSLEDARGWIKPKSTPAERASRKLN